MIKKKDEKTLEQKLETTKKKSKIKENNKKIEKLQKKIITLEKENQETQETCKRAQFDYINLKSDMDLLQRHTEIKEKNMKTESLLEITKKFLPFVEELRKSLENISPENKKTPLIQGLQLTYDKFIKTLETMHIFPIESIGKNPDGLLHEPVSTQPTDNKKLKGKIIQEFEKGFVYKKDGDTKVITTSKVIIGQ